MQEKFLRGYRSKLDHVNKATNSPRRTKGSDDDNNNQISKISVQGVENVMLEVTKLESEVTTQLQMKEEKQFEDEEARSNDDSNHDDIIDGDHNCDFNENGEEITDIKTSEIVENAIAKETEDIDSSKTEEVVEKDKNILEMKEQESPNEQGNEQGEEEVVEDAKIDAKDQCKISDVEESIESNEIEAADVKTNDESPNATVDAEIMEEEITEKCEKEVEGEKTLAEDLSEECWRDMISRGELLRCIIIQMISYHLTSIALTFRTRSKVCT